jgi:hypothetical protein
MKFKQDIEEGAEVLHGFHYGRMLSIPDRQERYVSLRIGGFILFSASGYYGGKNRMSRWWVHS